MPAPTASSSLTRSATLCDFPLPASLLDASAGMTNTRGHAAPARAFSVRCAGTGS